MASQRKSTPEFLSGGGEMGELIRNFNWEKTPLGVPENWDQSLKTCVRIMLTSSQPIWIGWGKELIKLYNDPYKAIVGGKHPYALGQPASIVWKDIWKDIEPLLRKTIKTNEGTYSESQLLIMERYGYPEETYYTFSYTPIPGDKGGTEGIFCANTEDTERVINERFLKTLQELGTLSNKKNLREIYLTTAKALENNNKDFPCAIIYKIEKEGVEATAVAFAGIDKSHPELPEVINLKRPGRNGKNLAKAVTENRMVLSETKGRWKNAPKGGWDIPPKNFVHVPIYGTNKKKPLAILTAALNPYRKFDNEYQNFIELVASQLSLEVKNVMAYDEERKRAESLAELDRAKTLFFTNISHEFRTPLTLMLSPLEELLNKPKNNFSKIEKQHLETSHRNAIRLLRLVNTLLDFSRIESGRQKASFTPVDILSLTTNLASNFRSVIEKAGLKLIVKTASIQQPVYVDTEMWEKIVFNLLSNAFKYTMKGKITVELYSENNHLQLTVNDTGVGIPEKELPHMFDRFHRVENTMGRTFEGTGIGLSLIKELVQLHGGSVHVKSKIGAGSSFTVSIPFGKEHLPPGQVNDSIPDSSLPVHSHELFLNPFIKEANNGQPFGIHDSHFSPGEAILIVDDNADMREHLQNLLSSKYPTITAVNGKEALKKIKEAKPALILSDVMMPVMDGFQLVKETKQNADTAQIPIILLSARAGEEAKIEGYETGADDYLVKPFSAKELLARIASQIKIAQAHQLVKVKLKEAALEQANANKIIGRKKDELQNLFRQAPVTIVLYSGENFVVEMINTSALEMWGKAEKEVINKPFFEISPELKEKMEPLLKGVLATGKTFFGNEFPASYMRNGQPHSGYFDFSYQAVRDENNKITGIISIGTEVTEEVVSRNKIEENELRTRIAVESGQLGTFEIDLIHCTIIFSKRLSEIFGLDPAKKGTHQDLKNTLHPDDLPLRDKAYEEALQTGTLYYEARVIWKDDSVHWICINGKVQYENGKAHHIYGIAEDITEEKETTLQLKETLNRIKSILESLPQMAWTTDAKGNADYFNAKWYEFTGLSESESMGTDWTQIIHPDDASRVRIQWNDAITSGATIETEFRIRRADGKYKWHFGVGVPQHNMEGKIISWIGTTTNIDEQKVKEQKKDEFIGIASHEMKTPLTTANAYIQLLEVSLGEENNNATLYAKKATSSLKRLNELITELLDVSKIKNGKLNYNITTFNFDEMIDNAIESIQHSSPSHAIIKSGSVQQEISGDKERLQQVVINLLSNAIKYSPGAGKVFIKVETLNNEIKVSVKDNGIGISKNNLKKIFERYYRVEEEAIQFQGLGIGLFISFEIIERHHGKLWAESENGKGSTFYFTLPIH